MATTIAWISAHPDDETFSSACTISEAVRRGCRSVLLCATDGDAGKTGHLGPMSQEELAARRTLELQRACDIMGISAIRSLHLPDGKLPEVPREKLVDAIIDFLIDQGADVALTFGEDGMSGHRDHIALHHAVREAVASGRCAKLKKLYYFFNPLPGAASRPATVTVDATQMWDMKVKALLAHESQLFSIERVFGDLRSHAPELSEGWREERFVLAWEAGTEYPDKRESFLTDGL